jgi:hypothetical protein
MANVVGPVALAAGEGLGDVPPEVQAATMTRAPRVSPANRTGDRGVRCIFFDLLCDPDREPASVG